MNTTEKLNSSEKDTLQLVLEEHTQEQANIHKNRSMTWLLPLTS